MSALAPVRKELEDVWRTEDDPDYGGARWLELYRGTPLDQLFVMTDFAGNAFHVELYGRDGMTVTYLPGWLFELATRVIALRPDGETALSTEDLDLARPLRIEVTVRDELGYEGTAFENDGYRRLPFGYDLAPSRAVLYEEVEPSQAGSAVIAAAPGDSRPRFDVRWTAPSLRVVAAPGVSVDVTPIFDEAELADLRQAYLAGAALSPDAVALQALRFELERRQDPFSLPALGAPARPAPMAEEGLAAEAAPLADGGPLIVERTRPDGADLLFIRSYNADMAEVGWLQALVEALLALPGAMLREFAETPVRWLGGLPDEVPLAVRIRVDPSSGEDRFAYRVDYLDAQRNAVTRGFAEDAGQPLFRLTVKRTPGVKVFVDGTFSDWGEAEVAQVIEYCMEEAPFDGVPFFIDPEAPPPPQEPLPDVDATMLDILRVAYEVGEFVPLPQVQVFYDLADVGSLGTYLIYGTDWRGNEMTRTEAGLTLGGLLLPELAERGGKRLFKSLRRLRGIGDDPFARVVAADAALVDEDLALVEGVSARNSEEP